MRAFEAMASRAGRLLPAEDIYSPVDPLDLWVDTVSGVWEAVAAVDGGMNSVGRAHEIAFVERLVEASTLTCAILAVNARGDSV